jgi:hypothetical protein
VKTYEFPEELLSATFRVLVSPGSGRLRFLPPRRFARGVELVDAGQPVARLQQGRQDVIVRAPVTGTVSAVLGLEGEPVVAGQPVLAIEPSPEG